MVRMEFKKELKVEDGMLLVSCPLCQAEFRAPVENMKDQAMNLKEPINCPSCEKELQKVLPDLASWEEMMEQARSKLVDDPSNAYV